MPHNYSHERSENDVMQTFRSYSPLVYFVYRVTTASKLEKLKNYIE